MKLYIYETERPMICYCVVSRNREEAAKAIAEKIKKEENIVFENYKKASIRTLESILSYLTDEELKKIYEKKKEKIEKYNSLWEFVYESLDEYNQDDVFAIHTSLY